MFDFPCAALRFKSGRSPSTKDLLPPRPCHLDFLRLTSYLLFTLTVLKLLSETFWDKNSRCFLGFLCHQTPLQAPQLFLLETDQRSQIWHFLLRKMNNWGTQEIFHLWWSVRFSLIWLRCGPFWMYHVGQVTDSVIREKLDKGRK